MASPAPASSSGESTPPTGEVPIPDEPDNQTEMPLTMAASMILTSLPKDASAALEGAGDLPYAKVTVRLQAVGSAPILKQRVFKVGSTQPFSTVVAFLRKKLGAKQGEGVFCYVNSVFAPGGDEVMGNLWRVGIHCMMY